MVLIAFSVLLALAIWSATGLRVDTDSSKMIDLTLPFQEREAALKDAFPLLDDTIAIVVRAPSADAADAVLDALGEVLRDDPTVADVFAPSTDPFFRTHGLLYLPMDAFQARLAAIEQTAPLLATLAASPDLATLFTALDAFETRGGAALDPVYGSLATTLDAALAGRPAALAWSSISAEASDAPVLRVLQVRPVPDYSDLQPVQGTIDAISAAINGLNPALAQLSEIGVTGDPALRHEELDSVSRGIGLSLGGSFIVVAILLLVAYGSAARAGATLLALVVSLVLATGVAAASFAALNLVSVAFVVLLVGLGLDFTIHALLHVDAEGPPEDRAKAIAEMGREIGGALVLGAATTALAFLAFVPTDFDGIAQLGVLGAAGVIIALVVSLTFVPALVMAWPALARGRPPRRSTRPAPPARTRSAWLMALLVVLVPVAIFVGREVRFDADPTVLRDPNTPSMEALAWLHGDAETAPYRLSLLTGSAEDAAALAADLEQLPEVGVAQMLDDFLPVAQEDKLALFSPARDALNRISQGQGTPLPDRAVADAAEALARRLAATDRPEAKALRAALLAWGQSDAAAQNRAEEAVFLLFPRLVETADLQSRAAMADRADIPTPIASRFLNDGVWRVDVAPAADTRDQETLEAFVQSVTTRVDQIEGVTLAGPPVHILLAGQTVASAIVQAVIVAGIATLLLCFVMLRDWRLVVAIVIPLAAAAAFTAAASAGLGIAFNYANVIVLPLIIGLGVDSGIHLALRHRGLQSNAGLLATNTPRAVVFSGLTTIAAFGSLVLSDHQGTASMGAMLAVAVSLTLATTLIWTPALCELLTKRKPAPNA